MIGTIIILFLLIIPMLLGFFASRVAQRPWKRALIALIISGISFSFLTGFLDQILPLLGLSCPSLGSLLCMELSSDDFSYLILALFGLILTALIPAILILWDGRKEGTKTEKIIFFMLLAILLWYVVKWGIYIPLTSSP